MKYLVYCKDKTDSWHFLRNKYYFATKIENSENDICYKISGNITHWISRRFDVIGPLNPESSIFKLINNELEK